jgi:hypothetical protein
MSACPRGKTICVTESGRFGRPPKGVRVELRAAPPQLLYPGMRFGGATVRIRGGGLGIHAGTAEEAAQVKRRFPSLANCQDATLRVHCGNEKLPTLVSPVQALRSMDDSRVRCVRSHSNLHGIRPLGSKNQGVTLPIYWILLGASMVVMLWTTGALKNGEFFGEFYECTRAKTPVSFWANVVMGYAFAAALIGLFVWGGDAASRLE